MSTTDGGFAKGMPRNLFTPSAIVPMNLPLSSVTIGGMAYIVGAAKTVAVAAQMATRDARRKAMTSRDGDWRVPRGTSRQHHEVENRI